MPCSRLKTLNRTTSILNDPVPLHGQGVQFNITHAMTAEQNLLFSPSLISPAVASSFPPGYTIRPLARDDYHRGFFQCLQTLTATGDITEQQFLERYDWMKAHGQEWYYCVVIVDERNDRIVGTGAMVVERKLYVQSRTTHIRRERELTHWFIFSASTTSAQSDTSKTSPSAKTTRAKSSASGSSTRSTRSPSTSAATRRFWTAQSATRASMPSAGIRGPGSRWHITTRRRRVSMSGDETVDRNKVLVRMKRVFDERYLFMR